MDAIVQTSDGHLWIGTQRGVARFNGVEFTVFWGDGTERPPAQLRAGAVRGS